MGVVVADAHDATAGDVEVSDRLGVLENQPSMACHAASAGDATPFAALMADKAAAAATAPCAPGGKVNLTPAEIDPGAISTVAAVASGNCASIAACTAAVSAALSGLANVICVVTAEGVAAADASTATAVDANAGVKPGVLANQLPIPVDANAAADEAEAAAVFIEVETVAAAATPAVPGGNVS